MQFGVFIPGHWMDHGKSAKQLYDEMLAEAVFADELGFDNIWLAEHYAIDYIAIPDPLQLATTIFERTETIKAGVAVLILRNHHPIKLAAEISQIDVMYGGRFEAALGRGASGYELRQMQLEMEESASRRLYNEHLEVTDGVVEEQQVNRLSRRVLRVRQHRHCATPVFTRAAVSFGRREYRLCSPASAALS